MRCWQHPSGVARPSVDKAGARGVLDHRSQLRRKICGLCERPIKHGAVQVAVTNRRPRLSCATFEPHRWPVRGSRLCLDVLPIFGGPPIVAIVAIRQLSALLSLLSSRPSGRWFCNFGRANKAPCLRGVDLGDQGHLRYIRTVISNTQTRHWRYFAVRPA